MTRRAFITDVRGAAAAELALMLPLLMVLLAASLEGGYFLWSEHKAIQAVRNGARYASRLPVTTVCPSAGSPTAAIADVALITRTGQLASSTAPALLPGWTANNQVSVSFNCGTFLATGIYATLGGNGPTVKVATSGLTYRSLFGTITGITSSIQLNAAASTAVIGI